MMQANHKPFRPIVPYQGQFKTMIGIALAISVACVVALIAGLADGFGPQLIAAVFAAIALLIWLIGRGYRTRLAALRIEDAYVHWDYDEAIWSAYREKFAAGNAKLPLKLAALLACSGLLAAVLISRDGELIWNTVATTYAVMIGAGAALGHVLGLAIRWLDNGPLHLMERHKGECVIGPAGLYITGQFWPWKTVGQRLAAATLSEGEDCELRFEFQTGTARKIVSVPVPPGQREIALDVIGRLRAP